METLQLFKSYKELFSRYYVENNVLENEETTQNEFETLVDLEPDKVYDNLKELVNYLVEFKRKVVNTEYGETQNMES